MPRLFLLPLTCFLSSFLPSILISFFSLFFLDSFFSSSSSSLVEQQQAGTTTTTTNRSDGSGFYGSERERIDVFEMVAPSVVNVDTFVTGKEAFSTDV